MGRKSRRGIAGILAILLVFQILGTPTIVHAAKRVEGETVYSYDVIPVYSFIIADGGTLYANSRVTSVEIYKGTFINMNTCESLKICDAGMINNTSGHIYSATVEYGGATMTGGSVNDLTIRKAVTFNNVTVNGHLNVYGSNINVSGLILNSPTTNVNINNGGSATVSYEGETYNFTADDGYTSLTKKFGTMLTIDASAASGFTCVSDDVSGTKYWSGATSAVAQYELQPGYVLPANYISSITGGSGSVTASFDESTHILSVSYTMGEAEADDVTITLPAATPLDSGTVAFSIPDVYEGQEVSYTFGAATQYDTSTAIIKYKQNAEDDAAYTTEKPTAVGDYTALVTLPATYEYGAYSQTYSFSIMNLEDGHAEITVADILVGETLNLQYSSTTNATTPIVEYKLVNDDDSAYSTTVPTVAGNYNARVTFPATVSHAAAVATTSFQIHYLQGAGSISVADVYVGTEISPVYASDKNGITDIVIEYRLVGDTEYTTEKPTAVGTYEVKATFPATEIYDTFVATDTFEIKDLENGIASITVKDVFFGHSVKPVYESSTNKGDHVVILYKETAADDSTYSATVPTQVGKYTVKAIFEPYGIYKEVVVTDDFIIEYLDAPEEPYTVTGKLGNNNIYRSKVTVTAKEGYLISETLGGEYVDKLVYDATTTNDAIYLKKIDNGAMTDGIAIDTFSIDMDAPVIDLKDKKVYYKDSIEVKLVDDDIVKILVNEKKYTGKALEKLGNLLVLTSDGGTTEYTIQVWDKAGNKTKREVTVASKWTEKGIIPSGNKVKLKAGKAYSFGPGKWKVEGDKTEYAGDITFYVNEDGDYTFVKE